MTTAIMFFEAVVQAILLFILDKWVVTTHIICTLELFHNMVT